MALIKFRTPPRVLCCLQAAIRFESDGPCVACSRRVISSTAAVDEASALRLEYGRKEKSRCQFTQRQLKPGQVVGLNTVTELQPSWGASIRGICSTLPYKCLSRPMMNMICRELSRRLTRRPAATITMCLLWFIHFRLFKTASFVSRQSHFERAPDKGDWQPYPEQEFYCYQKLKPPHSRSITCNHKC